MIRKPLKAKASQRQRITTVSSYPSPVGGWNTRDPLAAMKPTEAISLDNWFPQTGHVEIRGGSSSHATGMTGNGKTLMVYNAMAGTAQMFCATASGIFNVSSAGAVGASVLARTNGKIQWKMFGDGTNNWLIACNGVDAPAYYNGTTWTAVTGATSPALTGITTTKLVSPIVYKGRLMFLEVDSLSFWYLSSGIAGGALTEFDLSAEFKRGGYIVAAENWTRDAGDGADDVMVFVSSQGEAVVYQGNDPSSAANWSKIGTFFVGKPIGRKCMTQWGGDLVLLTENGTFPMSAAMQSAVIDYKQALSFKIETAFTDAARSYGSVYGWTIVVFPLRNALIVNVPQVEDQETHKQYVMNTITKSWCRFLEWEAEDFVVYNNDLYYCDGTSVIKAWTGMNDQGSNIEAYAKQSFNFYNSPGLLKQFKLFRPLLSVNGTISYLVDIDVDFEDNPIAGQASYSASAGAQWDVSQWDQAYWAASYTVVKEWATPSEWTGYCAASKLKVVTNLLEARWAGTDMMWEPAGVL